MPAPPRILWFEGTSPGELVVQIRTTDRAGLLARLTAVFERDGVDIALGEGHHVGLVGGRRVLHRGRQHWRPATRSRAGPDRAAVREELERDLYAVLPAPAPAKPVSEAS